jgi:tRNA pseudouridine38-40 synthase
MPRYRLHIEYDGTPYCGWQYQDDVPTVQGAVEKALYSFCGNTNRLICAGRTDAGVHAVEQVAHIDLEDTQKPFTIQQATNYYLAEQGDAIAVTAVSEVSEAFHARFSAQKRHYRYIICNRRPRVVLEQNRVWHVPLPLNVTAMQEAAQHLVGNYDFSSFRDSQCQSNSPVKTLDRLDIIQKGEHIVIETSAKSFLHHQVRIMVGSLVKVGHEKWTIKDFIDARDAKDRKAGGQTAPAHALYFMNVDYAKSESE